MITSKKTMKRVRMNKPREGTIKRINYDHAFSVLRENNFHMTNTAKKLDVSVRTLRNWRQEMEKMGYEIEYNTGQSKCAAEIRTGKKITISTNHDYQGFASNAQRVAYLDNPRKRYFEK